MNDTTYKPIKINFTQEEHQLATAYAKQCGITVVELCRRLLNRYHPKPMPVPAFRDALNQLYELHETVKRDDATAVRVREIILSFQKLALMPERSGAIGSNEPVGNQGPD